MNMTSLTAKKEKLWSPIFVTILAMLLFSFMVGQGVNCGSTVYLERTGGTVALAGIGAMIFSAAAGVMRICCGPLVDNRGRRFTLLIGAVFLLVGTIGPLVQNSGALFILWRALQGIGFSAATTAANTAAADVLPFTRLGEGIGYAGLGQAASMAIGPALALFLVSSNPPENLYYGLIACSILFLLLALICRYEKDPQPLPETSEYRVRWEQERGSQAQLQEQERRAKETDVSATPTPSMGFLHRLLDSIFEPTALRGTAVITFMSAGFTFSVFYMGSFGNSLGVANAGLYYTIMAVVMIGVRLISGRFMDSASPLQLMGVAAGSGIAAFALAIGCGMQLFGSLTQPLFYAIGIPFGLFIGLGMPLNQTMAVKLTPPERWGAANALFMLGIDISGAVFSVIWGFLIESQGYPLAFAGCLLLQVIAFVVALIVYPKRGART